MSDEKLDRLLEDGIVTRTKLDNLSADISELKTKLEPVFYHVNGVRWVAKVGIATLGVLSCVATVLALWK